MSLLDLLLVAGLAAYAVVATGLWLRAAGRLRRAFADLDLMRHDPVTGLLTRRPWLEMAHHLLGRYANPVVVMCDVNNFKRVNDEHSHADGDAVLAHFARLLLAEFDETALVGRFGGDEFVILTDLPRTDLAALDSDLNAALLAVAHCVVFWRGGMVGASFGIARAADLPGYTRIDTTRLAAREQLGSLLHAADLACRQAKHRCRAKNLATATQVFDPDIHSVPEHLPTAPPIRTRHS
jgi:diguanylate cyclase (GGDEF)-like protein